MKPKANYAKSMSYLFSRFILGRKYLTAYSSKYNLYIKFLTPDGGGRAIYKTGLYEEKLTNFIVKKLKFEEGDVIIDIGANIGWYTNLLATCYKNSHIHSFEPDPTNFLLLKENVSRNAATNTTLNNVGVGEQNDTKKLYLYKKSNIGRHSMLDINDGPFIEVEIVSLDSYVATRKIDPKTIKFLKIDIEGYEYFAFQGAQLVLKEIPLLFAEFSPGYMRKGGVEPKKLLGLLQEFGFKPYSVEGLNLFEMKENELLQRDKNINLFWVKDSFLKQIS